MDDKEFESIDSEDERLAIRDVTLSIRAGEKVAICGRTGR
jgi:ABC-type multidrug transport system fused ATPase/permease subunit